jgi:hypothetical protein
MCYLCNLKSVSFINTIFKWYHSTKSKFINNLSISIFYYSILFRCNGRVREEKRIQRGIPVLFLILLYQDVMVGSGRRGSRGYPCTIFNSTLLRCNGRVREEKRIQRGIPVLFLILLYLDVMARSETVLSLTHLPEARDK